LKHLQKHSPTKNSFSLKNIGNNIIDSSGQGNNGYIVNNISTSSSVVVGKIGQGITFDGVDDYIVTKNIVNTAKVTISAWIKMNSIPSSNVLITGFINGLNSSTYDKDLYMFQDDFLMKKFQDSIENKNDSKRGRSKYMLIANMTATNKMATLSRRFPKFLIPISNSVGGRVFSSLSEICPKHVSRPTSMTNISPVPLTT
jgi:hypothetical protein